MQISLTRRARLRLVVFLISNMATGRGLEFRGARKVDLLLYFLMLISVKVHISEQRQIVPFMEIVKATYFRTNVPYLSKNLWYKIFVNCHFNCCLVLLHTPSYGHIAFTGAHDCEHSFLFTSIFFTARLTLQFVLKVSALCHHFSCDN